MGARATSPSAFEARGRRLPILATCDYRIAFIEDPDGYKIELVQHGTMKVGDMMQ